MSTVYQIASSWKGFSAVRRFVIFGDSYSAVQNFGGDEPPSVEHPLGVAFPGITYNEEDRPNWVGHLITKYCPVPRFDPTERKQSEDYINSPLFVHDYARGGDTIAGVRRQVQQLFLPTVGKKPTWAPWTSYDTIFITWVGINDCAYSSDPESAMKTLFSLQEQVYEAGARNFMFIDVPTIHRAPAVPTHREASMVKTFENWNSALGAATQSFCATHPDISVFLFSSFHAFGVLLDDPEAFNCKSGDAKRHGGSIWMDHLHPTSQVHDHIAKSIAEFLGNALSDT